MYLNKNYVINWKLIILTDYILQVFLVHAMSRADMLFMMTLQILNIMLNQTIS